MGFTGRIEDLPVVDLFQYLSAGKKDGTCILSEGDEKAYVYFHEGNVVHALSPHRINIGDILIKAKKIGLKTLQKALIAQARGKDRKTIGQILVDMGAIDSNQLRVAVQMQLKEVVQYLVTWKKGEFSFEHNEIIPVDDINLNPAAVIPQSTKYTTTQLLMEAVSRLDQEEPGKPGKPPDPVTIPSPSEEKALQAGPPGGGPPAAPGKEKNGGAQGATEGAPADKPLVILLTADGVFKNLLREGLQKKGFAVVMTATVENGLTRVQELLAKGETFTVLTDHRLPGSRRAEQAAGIRFLTAREGSGGKFKAVIMTDSDNPEITADLTRAGAQAVIPKPLRGAGDNPDFPSEVKQFCAEVAGLIQRLLSPAGVR